MHPFGLMMSLKTHNVLDYVFGAVLALCPYFFDFTAIDLARNVFQTAGVGLIVYSLLTNYRYSVVKWIPVRLHMGLDIVVGGLLLVAPWFFGYRNVLTTLQTSVHVIGGLAVWGLVAFTRRGSEAITGKVSKPSEEKKEKEFPRAA